MSDAEVQQAQDLVEQVAELAEQTGERATVELTGDGAEQVAEELTGTGDGDDVEHHALQADLQAPENFDFDPSGWAILPSRKPLA